VPENVTVTPNYDSIRSSRLVVLAVPSSVAPEVASALGDHVDGSHYVVHGVRGLVGEDMQTVSDLVRKLTPAKRVGALGGPALASDLLKGLPSVLVSGSRFPEVNEALTAAFNGASLRVYSTPDIKGLEWASALVGCLAIAIGFAQGLSTSPGLVAALICRSMGEAARIAAAAGGDERTILGLAGYGDLLASIEQHDRPEVRFGRAMAKGLSVSAAREEAQQRLEAIELIPRVVAWCEANSVRAPIFRALMASVLENRPPSEILAQLMSMPMKEGA
jgi:glycerol-3-phosphate dehydrogenase (NAD(P)+)